MDWSPTQTKEKVKKSREREEEELKETVNLVESTIEINTYE